MPEPFADFMARALFDPERGYYTRRIQTVGACGDFSTSATLSPLLGQAVAGWLREEARRQPRVRHIIEVGAGDGSLMRTVRQELGWWTRRKFRFHIVETSPVLLKRQAATLRGGVTWHGDLQTALAACGGAAFIYHNELLDAFPVTLVEWHEGAWQEVYLTEAGGEELHTLFRRMAVADWTDFSVLANAPDHPCQRCELHLSVRDWLSGWAPFWKQGAMLTVDYGDEFPTLYYRRPRGTLRAYLLHQRLEGAAVYQNAGRQDITADINFTDYRAWARALGWEEVMYDNQAEFIRQNAPRAVAKTEGAEAFLMNLEGAGGAFKCVVHRRGGASA